LTLYYLVYNSFNNYFIQSVLEQIKPGVNWEDLHRLANRICVDGLVAARILKGSIDELLKHHMGAIFFPHGLGHLIGLDVHDVGGYPKVNNI
jgi:Xaa-Pro dipeptidase